MQLYYVFNGQFEIACPKLIKRNKKSITSCEKNYMTIEVKHAHIIHCLEGKYETKVHPLTIIKFVNYEAK